jgi:hypothetical protein
VHAHVQSALLVGGTGSGPAAIARAQLLFDEPFEGPVPLEGKIVLSKAPADDAGLPPSTWEFSAELGPEFFSGAELTPESLPYSVTIRLENADFQAVGSQSFQGVGLTMPDATNDLLDFVVARTADGTFTVVDADPDKDTLTLTLDATQASAEVELWALPADDTATATIAATATLAAGANTLPVTVVSGSGVERSYSLTAWWGFDGKIKNVRIRQRPAGSGFKVVR